LVIAFSGVATLGRVGIAVALLAYVLAAVGVRWIWGTVAGALGALSQLLSMWSTMFISQLVSNMDTPGSTSAIIGGIILLVGAIVGGGLVFLEYRVSRPYAWPPDTLEPEDHPRRRLRIGLLLVLGVALALATGGGNLLYSWLFTERSLSYTLMGSMNLVMSLVALVAYPLGGVLGDVGDWLGRRVVGRPVGRLAFLLLGLALLAVGFGIVPTVQSRASILLAVGLQSLGGGLLNVQVIPLLFSSTRPRRWATVYGLYLGISHLCHAGAVLLYGQLAEITDMVAVFYIGAVFAVVGMLIPVTILFTHFFRTTNAAAQTQTPDIQPKGGSHDPTQ
jgi:hypothetical protein